MKAPTWHRLEPLENAFSIAVLAAMSMLPLLEIAGRELITFVPAMTLGLVEIFAR